MSSALPLCQDTCPPPRVSPPKPAPASQTKIMAWASGLGVEPPSCAYAMGLRSTVFLPSIWLLVLGVSAVQRSPISGIIPRKAVSHATATG